MFKKEIITPLSNQTLKQELNQLKYTYNDESGTPLESCEMSQAPVQIQAIFKALGNFKLDEVTYFLQHHDRIARTCERRPEDLTQRVHHWADGLAVTYADLIKRTGVKPE